jgi:hypothetical protein
MFPLMLSLIVTEADATGSGVLLIILPIIFYCAFSENPEKKNNKITP